MARAQGSLLDRFQAELNSSQSYFNLVLGLLIVVVIGLLVYNYFQKDSGQLGPAQDATNTQQGTKDVEVGQLPGKYTVKEGDTLFTISEKYYQSGEHFMAIAQANKLVSPDLIEAGQVLDLPKLETLTTTADATTSAGTGGAENQTTWGERITGDTYTVAANDWLSKIAGRAYGDVMKYDVIAKANNIQNPDLIEPGMTLRIPR